MTVSPIRADVGDDLILAERVVVGAMMSGDLETAVDLAATLTAEDFHRSAHGLAFRVSCDLRSDGLLTDPLPVWTEMLRRSEVETSSAAYGMQVVYLVECVEVAATVGNVGWYARQVADAADRRRTRETFLSALGYLDSPDADVAEVIGWTTTELSRTVARGLAGPAAVDDESFWFARPCLAHVREFARARMASPWAVLGVALVRVLSQVPPEYVLPATIGSHASLNLFLAVVAPSGGGKGAAMGAARDACDVGDVNVWPVGTGEGLVKTFVHYDKDAEDIVQDETSAVIEIHEVDQLGAVKGRTGATILSVLRSGWVGEEVGFNNADATRRLKVAPHAYRLGLVVGVQPGRADVLLNEAEAAGGTPQRFVWLPGTDPAMPDEMPAEPKPWEWDLPGWPDDVEFHPGRLRVLDVCAEAIVTIREAHRRRQRGDAEALDGHALLCRLKVAAALGLLDGHARVTAEDWRLAGTLMDISDRTRQSVVDTLRRAAAERNRARAEADAERAVIVADRTDGAQTKKACAAIMRCLHRADGWVSQSDLRSAARRYRDYLDDAVGRLAEAGQIEIETVVYQGQQGRKYRRVPT
ncbi:DnaB-like helicase N terminal domain [Frankia torreyi]|uniref:DnaB-like helicase N terminal domain n=2 Tax=Frankia TaxID=1854 RepID=A0A0D8BHY6_9ACTN|nr:DnaB-like helicase N-terminal domain-containing protein [Frankia torreyi]KJE23690.1 DnaB-like helicase N terminal domain [Frankia torreyi]KQM05698.1 DnaB-like helicase N terminal domain [Frankia sp. CpI1-P]